MNAQSPDRSARLALLALVAGAVAIAFSPIWVRLSDLAPTASAFHRVFLALPLLWGWMWLDGRRPVALRREPTRRDIAWLLLGGLFFTGDLALWHWSISFTSVANATLFANFAPIFVTIGAFALFGQRVSRLFLVGMAAAIGGAMILLGQSFTVSPDHLFGDGLGLATAVFYAAYILTVGRLRARLRVSTVMAWTGLGTTAGLLPVAWLSGHSLVPGSLEGWGVLLGLAWISHSGGQGLIAYALAHLPVSFSSVGLLLQPVIAALLAWVLLGEGLGVAQGLGMAVILGGIYVARVGSR